MSSITWQALDDALGAAVSKALRRELLTAAETLRASLGEGIDIGGVWLYPEDGIETDASDGVLAAMLRLEWIETAGEPEGEPMEELEYNNTGGE